MSPDNDYLFHRPAPQPVQPVAHDTAPPGYEAAAAGAGLPPHILASMQVPVPGPEAYEQADDRPDDDDIDGYRIELRRGNWIQVAPLDVISNGQRDRIQRVLSITSAAGQNEAPGNAMERAFKTTKTVQRELLEALIEAWSFPIELPATLKATDALPGWVGPALDDILNKALIGLFPDLAPSLDPRSPTPPSAG